MADQQGMINNPSDNNIADHSISATPRRQISSSSGSSAPHAGILEDMKELASTPDIHNVSIKIKRADEAYREFARIEEQPSNGEIFLWYLYGLCSYFIQTALIPIVFPLIISQVKSPLSKLLEHPDQYWNWNFADSSCTLKEVLLYQSVTNHSISIQDVNFTPLEWTALSWGAGILISTPFLFYLSHLLDHTHHHQLIFRISTAIGSIFCLPAGFFQVTWIFPPYIAAIIAASIISSASHTRHFGLMLRGFSNPTTTAKKSDQIADRRSVSSWLSVNATAAGSFGASIIAAFTYYMLHHSEPSVSLWVVSIFSGLKWLCGIIHAFTANRPGQSNDNSNNWSQFFSIFEYPHAVGSVVSVLLSSFTTTCIFTGGVLYMVGHLCVKPVFLFFMWLIYFIFPLFYLPLSHPLQQLLKVDAVRMQLFGYFISAITSALGFYYRQENWHRHDILLGVALQSVATGVLYAFGRVLLVDCTPVGKEGSFSVWFAWVRTVGMCGGFAVASAFPGNVMKSFGIAFFTSITGVIMLIFGKISNSGGAVAAGHVRERDGGEEDWNVEELDKNNSEGNGRVHMQISTGE